MKVSTTLLMVIGLCFISVDSIAGDIDQFLGSRSVAGKIYFLKGSSQLSNDHKQALDKVIRTLKENHEAGQLIRVEGFSSPDGDKSFNYNLSMQRATVVQEYLQMRKLPTMLFLTGHGEKNDSTVKLSELRRVDIVIYQENRAVKQLFQNSGQIERFVIQ